MINLKSREKLVILISKTQEKKGKKKKGGGGREGGSAIEGNFLCKNLLRSKA